MSKLSLDSILQAEAAAVDFNTVDPVLPLQQLQLPDEQVGASRWLTFDRTLYMTVGQGDPRKTSETRVGVVKHAIKWGQLKLLITELDFLVRYWDPAQVPNPICVYVGAAPGHHLAVLAELFPTCTFQLFDERDFDPRLATYANITLNQRYFTTTDLEQFKQVRDRVYFFSDIRGLTYDRAESVENDEVTKRVNEEIVKADMDMQMAWVLELQPVKAHLKFRLPYSWDFVRAAGDSREYLDGTVYRQPWTPQISAECRLIPHSDLNMRKWDYTLHEEQMFYHNVVIREKTTAFFHPFRSDMTPISEELGLTNDYDSTSTVYTVIDYLTKVGQEPSEANTLKLLKYMITKCHPPTTLVGLRSGLRNAAEAGDN
jgi:hypothetical protein